MTIALVHDYLTQRGGAERVVLSMTRAFPEAPLYTSLFDPVGTFPEFADVDVRPLPLNGISPLRRRHRLAFPLLGPTFSRTRVRADVVLCSSSGWAHGVHAEGHKIVYCHTPARWLYQPGRYLRGRPARERLAAHGARAALLRWDRAAAASADRYLANSSVVAARIRDLYAIEAEVLPPPPALTPHGATEPVEGLDRPFFLAVSRLLPYKNLDAVVLAFRELPDDRLVLVGRGPDEPQLRALAGSNVALENDISDAQLRWLYANCDGILSASHEDFGLTPLEAAGFGKPSATLRWGGFLETVDEGVTGIFFDQPDPRAIAGAVRRLRGSTWDELAIVGHAERFAEPRFIDGLRATVAAVQASGQAASDSRGRP